MTPRLLYRVTEAAQAIGVSRGRAYELINADVIPAIRVGGSIRVPVQELQQWIQDQHAAEQKRRADLKAEHERGQGANG